MHLTSKNDLSIVEIIFYLPAFFISIFVAHRHGFGRQLGWIFITILSLIRIIGSATGIAATSKPSTGLIECSIITSSVGLTPLLLAMLGILKRVNEGMGSQGVKPRLLGMIQLPAIAGLVLAILGGIKAFDKDPNTQKTGHTFQKAAILIFLGVLILLIGINAISLTKLRHIIPSEKRLLFATALSIPFLSIRLVYSIIAVFNPTSSIFGIQAQSNTATIVQALMAILMEFVVVTIYLLAGFLVPVISRSQVLPGYQPAYSRGDSHEGAPLQSMPHGFDKSGHERQQQGLGYEPYSNRG